MEMRRASGWRVSREAGPPVRVKVRGSTGPPWGEGRPALGTFSRAFVLRSCWHWPGDQWALGFSAASEKGRACRHFVLPAVFCSCVCHGLS